MRLAALFVLAALPASAEVSRLSADLDGNGVAETFTLTISDSDYATLSVTGDGKEVSTGPFVWYGRMAGFEPYLELAPSGSVLVYSGNEGIGRGRWNAALTLAFRDGAYRVAGYTYRWHDTIDHDNYGTCDINLLTGRGLLKKGDGPEEEIRTTAHALSVTEWTLHSSEPEECTTD